ncbi:MiaB-like tRNA modifying enzyme [Spirochaeta thermophila DSM 6578]|uniref:MiaB-like tRNA modifying enzyme n=1 Tax=Winmispira thermophila (strain ATCC 700085 / DSM 6578 / Z-1203) TaxID=869211 RepID=G0GFF0_WINT7|nr:tRNA (N(6)-L-threonylcarbamoyladenosine(37)-C(2))-methylthiotransferase MtaB [Spirochaeta thermophila]AEJ61564.1 MiaB-like tRNA modifying enzyme [Spirochaeta thermophila DSM 6578]
MKPVVIFYTLGCKLNQYETEGIAAAFREAGFRIGEFPQSGDLYIVNTCTVTSKSEQKARRIIRKIAREHPEALVVVTGCYPQLERDEVQALSDRVIALPLEEKPLLLHLPSRLPDEDLDPSRVERLLQEIRTQFPLDRTAGRFLYRVDRPAFHARSFLKIQDGCDRRCTYCRVPLARGRAVSDDPARILQRVQELEGRGVSEIVLTGVNLAQYRWESLDLGGLLLRLLSHTSRLRFRISSLEPEGFSEALWDALSSPRICPHFHLPVQSGSNRVLRKMGRWYTAEEISALIARLRDVSTDPFISGDFIVGFPGETREDFEATRAFLDENAFSGAHLFRYSPRPGTAAYASKAHVPERVAKEREEALHACVEVHASAYLARQKGRVVEVIPEQERVKAGQRYAVGTSENYLLVWVPVPLEGETVRVEVGDVVEGEGRSVYGYPVSI